MCRKAYRLGPVPSRRPVARAQFGLCVALEEMSLLAIGSSRADVERIIKDARRQARQQERPLSITDIRSAILGRKEELSAEELERAAIHEAGRIIVAVVHGRPADIHAVVAGSRRSAGFVVSTCSPAGRRRSSNLAPPEAAPAALRIQTWPRRHASPQRWSGPSGMPVLIR